MYSKRILTMSLLFVVLFTSLAFALQAGDDFVDQEFYSLDNKKVKASSYLEKEDAKYVIYDVWATWCGPCCQSLTDYQANIEYFTEKGIEIVGIAAGDTPNNVKKWLKKNPLSFDILIDKDSKTLTGWSVKGLPVVLLVNPENKVIMRAVSYDGFEDFQKKLEIILEKDAK